jgi:hypothetical protein
MDRRRSRDHVIELVGGCSGFVGFWLFVVEEVAEM